MAKIKYDQNGDPYLSGTLGKSLTFVLWRGVRVVKAKPLRRGPKHGAQIRLGRVIREAAGVWRKFSEAEREHYVREARKGGQQSGYQAFVKEWWHKNGTENTEKGDKMSARKTKPQTIPYWGKALILVGLLLAGTQAFGQGAFRFVTMADCRGSSDTLPDPGPVFTQIINKVDSLHPRPNLWIFGGDAYYSAADSDSAMVRWQVWKTKISPISDISIYLAIGNHEANVYYHNWDGAGPFKATWPQLPMNGPTGFLKLAYAVHYNNALFLIVDTDVYNNSSRVDWSQRTWLKTVLDTTTARHKFVIGHEEAYPPNNSTSSSLQYYPSARDSFWDILTSHHVDAYVCGHIHLWNQDFFVGSGHGNQPPDHSVRQVIDGSCGAGLVTGYGGNFYHYVVWDIHGDTVRAHIYNNSGVLRDSIIYLGPSGVEEKVPVVLRKELPTLSYHRGTISWLEEPDDFPEETEVTVFDIQGREIWSGRTMSSSIYWGEQSGKGRAASGIYMVRLRPLEAPPGFVVVGKIVVIH